MVTDEGSQEIGRLTALHYAVYNPFSPDGVEALLARGANPRGYYGETTPLHRAVGRDEARTPQVFGMLLDAGAEMEGRERKLVGDGVGRTALETAVDLGTWGAVWCLVKRGADLSRVRADPKRNDSDVFRHTCLKQKIPWRRLGPKKKKKGGAAGCGCCVLC